MQRFVRGTPFSTGFGIPRKLWSLHHSRLGAIMGVAPAEDGSGKRKGKEKRVTRRKRRKKRKRKKEEKQKT